MTAELLIYAFVAGLLIFWLKNTLGTRHGEERERENPLTLNKKMQDEITRKNLGTNNSEEKTDDVFAGFGFPVPQNAPQNQGEDWSGIPLRDEAFMGLKLIAAADSSFKLAKFLNGAKDVFPMIVESFAEGDKETLSRFLAPSLYKNFARAIDERNNAEQSMRTDIHAVRGATILNAELRGTLALITIRFEADETTVLRNKEGAILAGNPDSVTKLVDVWVLGRDVKSKDPTWYVFETRDDMPEQNGAQFPHVV